MINELYDHAKIRSLTFHEAYYKAKWVRSMLSDPTTDEEMASKINIPLEQFRAYIFKKEVVPSEVTIAFIDANEVKTRLLVQDIEIIDIATLFEDEEKLGEEG